MGLFVLIVKSLAFKVAVAVWSTVGLAMWIALVSRVTAIATLQITASLIGDGGHGKVDAAGKSIEETAGIWYRGFTAIVDGFYDPDNGGTAYQERRQLEKRIKDNGQIKWTRVASETIYSLCFYASMYSVYHLFWTR